MKKSILFLVLLLVLLPYQSAFAASVSTATVEKLYFENYKSKVKEVREAQKALYGSLCSEVPALTAKAKASATQYNNLVKSKAGKEAMSQAKAVRDQDKKALLDAKKACTKKVNDAKKRSSLQLREVDKYKRDLSAMIKAHLSGKDQMREDEFSKKVQEGLTYINDKLDNIVRELKNAR
ncbi:hypothetical protein [Paenibacillus sp. FSL W8-0194]|uniref:hypothetical protein n=1 Tax=Paenibacillus sp. FSL W8-0194 TaxID=2921711 RepID=UPI0030DCC64E